MTKFYLVLVAGIWPVIAALPTLESLHLTSDLGVQSGVDGFLKDLDGTKYDLSTLVPYEELLSPGSFIPIKNGVTQLDQRTGESFRMPIYRATFDDGTILQVQKDENDTILYAEMRHEKGRPDTYFVKTEGCGDDELLAFSEDQMNESILNEGSYFEDEEVPVDRRLTREVNQVKLTDLVDQRRDGTSSDCAYFKVVKVGIVYDAEFCQKYGGKNEARSQIMMIVAAASVLYEQDMCIKLQLTDIYSPDNDCSSTSAFESFRRDKACGSGNADVFIRHFRGWMNDNRKSLGLDGEATFHAFTGYPHRGTLGCGYIGVVCQYPDFAYGVDYMTTNSLSSQSIIFAHELGHNLSARHLSGEDAAGFRYIMNSSLNNPHDGFSQLTIDKILGFLDSDEVTCDGIAFREPTLSPTNRPTNQPSPSPTQTPSSNPSEVPTVSPSSIPSRPPTPLPTEVLTLAPADVREVPCSIEQIPSQPICILTSPEAGFGCYAAIDLMSVKPNEWCSLEQPFYATVAFVACEEQFDVDEISNDVGGISNDEGRMLRKKGNKASKKSNGGGGERAGDEGTIDLNAKNSVAHDSQTLEFFAAQDCSVGCMLVGDHVCFLSALSRWEDEKVYVLTFSATHGGEAKLFTSEVTIQRENSLLQDCDAPQTVCDDS